MAAYQAVTPRACQIRPGTTLVALGAIRAMVKPSVRMACWRLKVSAAMRRKSGFLGSKRGMIVSRHRGLRRQMLCRNIADRILEGRGLARLPVHVNDHGLAGCRDL